LNYIAIVIIFLFFFFFNSFRRVNQRNLLPVLNIEGETLLVNVLLSEACKGNEKEK